MAVFSLKAHQVFKLTLGLRSEVSEALFLFRLSYSHLFPSLLLRYGPEQADNAVYDGAGTHCRETYNTLTRCNVLGYTHC